MLASLAALAIAPLHNTLSPAEIRSGWKLLFDGVSLRPWHSFVGLAVRAGWKIENGTFTSANPHDAGDIVTDEQFDWFELKIDVNLAPGQNSGILLRVTGEDKEAAWHTGPEVQLYDHAAAPGVEVTGYLYQLYQPPAGVNAAKPAGQWNSLRIMVAPDKCFTEVNGVRYYEFVWGSDDFWARVARSKFSAFTYFAKATKGSIGIQGDHGVVSFRNVKIRPIKG